MMDLLLPRSPSYFQGAAPSVTANGNAGLWRIAAYGISDGVTPSTIRVSNTTAGAVDVMIALSGAGNGSLLSQIITTFFGATPATVVGGQVAQWSALAPSGRLLVLVRSNTVAPKTFSSAAVVQPGAFEPNTILNAVSGGSLTEVTLSNPTFFGTVLMLLPPGALFGGAVPALYIGTADPLSPNVLLPPIALTVTLKLPLPIAVDPARSIGTTVLVRSIAPPDNGVFNGALNVLTGANVPFAASFQTTASAVASGRPATVILPGGAAAWSIEFRGQSFVALDGVSTYILDSGTLPVVYSAQIQAQALSSRPG